jgi:hypothetical protein
MISRPPITRIDISARLGNLVVWVSYALAALLLGFAAFDPHHDATPWIVSIAVGGGAFVLGYAIRNLLTGESLSHVRLLLLRADEVIE